MADKRLNKENSKSGCYRSNNNSRIKIKDHDIFPPTPSKELKTHADIIIENNRGAWEKLAKE